MDKTVYLQRSRFVISNFVKIFLFVLLVSCSEDKADQYIDGDDLIPPKPSIWAYFTVNGVDADNAGVRDDFELLVNKEIDDEDLRKALKDYAKVMQVGITRSSTEEALRNVDEQTRVTMCINVLIRSKKEIFHLREIKSSYLNNWWRVNAFNEAARKYMPSGVYGGGSSNPLDELKACKFKVKRMKEILQRDYENGRYKYGLPSEETIEEYLKLMKELK